MNATYKMEELVGGSTESFADAARNAVEKAASSTGEAAWFEVVEMRGAVREGMVAEFQVKLKVGCKV